MIFYIGIFLFFVFGAGLTMMAFSAIFLKVPFIPTHKKQARLAIKLAQIGPQSKIIDLGSGAGRLIFLAAKTGATAIGYELNPFLYFWCAGVAWWRGYKNVKFIFQSVYEANLNRADVIFTFLSPAHMNKLADKFARELQPGAKVISYAFSWPNRAPTIKQDGLFVYEIK